MLLIFLNNFLDSLICCDKIFLQVLSHLRAVRRVAQGLERYLDTVEVGGSRPPVPTIKNSMEFRVRSLELVLKLKTEKDFVGFKFKRYHPL